MRQRPAKERLIVALDTSSAPSAFDLVRRLDEGVSFYKVGWRLFLTGGMAVVEELIDEGKEVFLDLKMDDIEETVKEAVRSITERDVKFMTIMGGAATARAAKEGRGEASFPKLLSVTLLSSMNEGDLRGLYAVGGSEAPALMDFVSHRAQEALSAGADGLIASGDTIAPLRAQFPDAVLVVPGIRPSGFPDDDHKRANTPADAIRAGADYLVVGRPVRDAADPAEVAGRIIEEIEGASQAAST